jgi:hypothetical protein
MGKVETSPSGTDRSLDRKTRSWYEIEWPESKVRLTNYQLGLIKDALGNLVGEPLTKMGRLSSAQYLRFGVEKPSKNYKGDHETRSDWGLWIGGSCHWQFAGPDGFLLGTDDFGPEGERLDDHANEFYDRLDEYPLIVTSIKVLSDGMQVLSLSDGFSLTIKMPDGVSRYSEPWRFMPRVNDYRGHLCLTESGMKWGFRLAGRRMTNAKARHERRKEIKYYPGTRLKKRFNRADQAARRGKCGE